MIKIQLLLMPILSFLNGCNLKTEPTKHGTTVIILFGPDSTILAADSRSTPIDELSGSITDTTAKVFNVGNTFFAMAGLSSLNGVAIRSIVSDNYNTNLPVEDNCNLMGTDLKNIMQRWFEYMSPDTRRKYDRVNIDDLKVGVYAFAYQNDQPCLYKILVWAYKKDGHYAVSLDPIRKITNNMITQGSTVQINKLVDAGYKMSNHRLNDLISMIRLEAKYDTRVDSIVNYCIVKPHSFEYGKAIPN